MANGKMRKILSLALVALLTAGIVAGCGNSGENNPAQGSQQNGSSQNEQNSQSKSEELSGTVTAAGSTALLPLVKQAASDFMGKHTKVTVNVTGGGSGTGLKQVAEGNVDIGNSDVEAGEEYKDAGLVDHVVAVAPFVLIVHKDVAVDNLTKQQAADIFTGKITNWKDVGGKDQKIVLVHRPESSGSRKLVKSLVLDGQEFSKDGVTQESSGALKTAVSNTPGAIGYVDIAYADDSVKALKFDGVEYSKENIANGSYKLYGVEHMYTKGEPTGAVKAFLDYILSDEFQNQRVEELKFLPAETLKQ